MGRLETFNQPFGRLSTCFLTAVLPPNAIVIEYIPNMQSIGLSNFVSPKQESWLREEVELMEYFVEALVVLQPWPRPSLTVKQAQDYKDGKIIRTSFY